MLKYTSYASFGQLLTELWPSEDLWYDGREECEEVKGILNSQWIVKKSRECD